MSLDGNFGSLSSRRSTSGTTTWLLSGRGVDCAKAPQLPDRASTDRQVREILFMFSAWMGGGQKKNDTPAVTARYSVLRWSETKAVYSAQSVRNTKRSLT